MASRHTTHTTRGPASDKPSGQEILGFRFWAWGLGRGFRVYRGHTRNSTAALRRGASASIENVNGDDESGRRSSCPCPWPCPGPCFCTRSPLAPAAVCAVPGFSLASLPPWPSPQSADQFEKGWEKPSMKTKRPWERGARGKGPGARGQGLDMSHVTCQVRHIPGFRYRCSIFLVSASGRAASFTLSNTTTALKHHDCA